MTGAWSAKSIKEAGRYIATANIAAGHAAEDASFTCSAAMRRPRGSSVDDTGVRARLQQRVFDRLAAGISVDRPMPATYGAGQRGADMVIDFSSEMASRADRLVIDVRPLDLRRRLQKNIGQPG